MAEKDRKTPAPPEIGPYVFPIILAGLGLWCFYDGWITSDPEMLEHKLFNQIASAVLLSWAIFDFLRTRRKEKTQKTEKAPTSDQE